MLLQYLLQPAGKLDQGEPSGVQIDLYASADLGARKGTMIPLTRIFRNKYGLSITRYPSKIHSDNDRHLLLMWSQEIQGSLKRFHASFIFFK